MYKQNKMNQLEKAKLKIYIKKIKLIIWIILFCILLWWGYILSITTNPEIIVFKTLFVGLACVPFTIIESYLNKIEDLMY